MSKPPSSRWSELFDIAYSLLQQAGERGLGQIEWTFGGGTALMLQIDHRESYDVDIFISDPQYLSLLNPEVQGFNLALTPSDYSLEGGHALKISFGDAGEIDFICCSALTDPAA
ncbi:nucleotidyl transferase AbiEii/AbiGii toxin family protein [Roseovarius sp. SYSU LYC5161]|uniref:nucleotidyl transferase AbiEii/AbiGii toxin family protein n=1 Tax=Roseovarius halophilus (ex Wu et al. 2025) TaxID=3376060 RepID=UPI00399BC723